MPFRVIAWLCAIFGMMLAISIQRTMYFAPYYQREWYESEYLPLWVGSVVCAVVAVLTRPTFRQAVIIGMLVTGLPYFWYVLVLAYELMLGVIKPFDFLQLTVLRGGLAISGVVVAALVSRMMGASTTQTAAPRVQGPL